MQLFVLGSVLPVLYVSAVPFSPSQHLSFAQKQTSGIFPRDNIRYDRDCNATGYGPWACKTCDDPTIKDDTKTSQDKWTAADGNNGWEHVKEWWTVLRDGGGNPLGAVQGFVQSVSWYWNGPTQWDCADIGETHCSDVVTCKEANVPVAGMTLTSFANIHMFYDNLYTALHDAGGSMGDQLGQFSSTFAPQGPATVDLLKLILDGFAISYGLIGAGVWNKILKDSPIFKDKGNDHGWAKDSTNAAVANSVTIAKDAQPGVQGQLNTLNDLTSELGALVDGWANVTSTYVSNLFSGSDEALTQLDAYVKDGNWADTSGISSLFSLQGVMENLLYGQLLPKAWSDHTEVHPVIVFQQGNDIVNPLTAILQGDAYRTLSDDDAKAARTQYGGTVLWLLDAHDCDRKEPVAHGGTGACDDPFVRPLPGASELTPGNKWGGVLVDDINISAFVGYQINNNANGYVMPDNSLYTSENQDADYPFQAGIRTPGFFSSIPVCDITTVFDVTVRNRGNEGTKNRLRNYTSKPPPPISAYLPIENVPHVTILRPVKDIEPQLYACLAATFQQNYPSEKLTIYFCVSSRLDPALPILEQLLSDYPAFDARILVEEEDPNLSGKDGNTYNLGPNPKIRNMSRGYREAKGDIIWIIDCNVWVSRSVCGSMVDRLCGLTPDGRKYKFVHQLPLVMDISDSTTAWGSLLEELFLSTSHAKFYTAISTVAVAPCIVGKSNMFRRSHLNALTTTPSSKYAPGIDFFSDNICEDHLIGDLLWKRPVPPSVLAAAALEGHQPPSSSIKWSNHALLPHSLALQPMAHLPFRTYLARRTRWLRVRKFTVPLATLVEPGTENLLCSLYGAYGFTYLLGWSWGALAVLWVAGVLGWGVVDVGVWAVLQSGGTYGGEEGGVGWVGEEGGEVGFGMGKKGKVGFKMGRGRGRRGKRKRILAWIGREVLALGIWIWAVVGGVEVDWRGRRFRVGWDASVREISGAGDGRKRE
ncbi:MAG: hypothetical protein Q9195_004109 [Heterodermia aff. obscurata]